jgi:hypothetical protein
MRLTVYCILFLFMIVFSRLAHAQDMVFPNYKTNVIHLETELRLFDLKANYHEILPNKLRQYISNISSAAYKGKKIDCYVRIKTSLLKGPLAEKKKRLSEFCEELFKVYQQSFLMIDESDLRTLSKKGAHTKLMNKSHLAIHINTYGASHKFIADWESGSMSYIETHDDVALHNYLEDAGRTHGSDFDSWWVPVSAELQGKQVTLKMAGSPSGTIEQDLETWIKKIKKYRCCRTLDWRDSFNAGLQQWPSRNGRILIIKRGRC